MRAPRAGRRVIPPTVVHAVADDDRLIEVAPVIAALERRGAFRQVVVHAGAAPDPTAPHAAFARVDHWLGTDGDTPATRTAAMLVAFETVLLAERPELVLLSGDEEATLAAALAAAKLGISVAHLGSGLRSWDWTLAEELNRSVIDRLSDTLFTPCADAAENLVREGIPESRIHGVGNTRIDMLRRYEALARKRAAWVEHGAREREYTLVTLRRRETLGAAGRLEQLASALAGLARDGVVLLLQHPATRMQLGDDAATALLGAAGVRSLEPSGYLDTLSLQVGAGAIVTDAPAVQEEASALGVPCYTMLAATASTVTLTHGTNMLLGDDPAALSVARPNGWDPTPAAIPLWDGHAAERVADALVANYTLSTAYAEDR